MGNSGGKTEKGWKKWRKWVWVKGKCAEGRGKFGGKWSKSAKLPQNSPPPEKLFLAAPIGSNVTLQCPVATPPAKATPTRKATPPARWFHWGHRIHRGAWPEGAELKLGPMGENHVGRYDCAIGERSGTVHVVLGGERSRGHGVTGGSWG